MSFVFQNYNYNNKYNGPWWEFILHLVVDDHDVVHPIFSLLNLIVLLLVRTDVDVEHEWMAAVGVGQVALHQFVPLPVIFFQVFLLLYKSSIPPCLLSYMHDHFL